MSLARTPGQRFTLPDGTAVQVMRAVDMPKRFIAAKKARGSESVRVLSTWRGGKWVFHDDPPYEVWESGGFYFEYLREDFEDPDYSPERACVVVPLVFLEPEQNEFGEVSP